MLGRVVAFSLRKRGVVIALACVLLGYGIHATRRAKLDVFPDFVPPQVVIQTEAPGLAPEQVEQLVTTPVEATLSGSTDLESLRSESIQGLSIVTAVFREGTSILLARQMLGERLAELRLPLGVRPPRMSPLTSSTMDLLKIGLVSDHLGPKQLRTLADWTVGPRLLAVPGVAKVSVFGGEVVQLQVQVDPDRLLAHDLSLTDVVDAARASTGVVGAGFVENENQRIVLQTEGQALTAEALGQTVVAERGGAPLRLAEVARVVEGAEPRVGDALVEGRPGVLMTLSSQYGANTMEVTRGLESALAELEPLFEREGVKLYPRLHRPATFIEAALGNLEHSLLLGAALVAAVLFLFLGHFRAALISVTAIPLSLLSAVIALGALGVTVNTLTLGGLAIAIGEVVDDAVIDVENIVRRLRTNRTRAHPRPAFDVVLEASIEVRGAIVYATGVVVLVFVPLLTLTGLQGSFFAPLGLAYLLAVLASLAVALTVTPALALTFFRGGVGTGEPRLQKALRAGYRRILERAARRPRLLIAAVAALCAAGLALLPFLGGGFLPEFQEGHYVLQVSAAPGTSLPEMLRIGTSISQRLLANPGIATVEQQIGRAEQGEDPWGPNRSEFHVELTPAGAARQDEVGREIRQSLAGFPGIQFEVLTFLGDRIGETLTGETAQVVVNLFGDDLDLLDEKAREVARVLAAVPGAADVRVKSPPGAPRMAVRLRSEALARFGFRPLDVLSAVQTAFQGSVVAQTFKGRQVTDVAVILDEDDRRDPEAIGSLRVRSAAGMLLSLSELAEVYPTSGRDTILHEGGRRRQTVTCNPEGRDVSSFVAQAKREVAEKVSLPGTVYLTFGGAAEARAGAERELLIRCGVAGVGIVLLLSAVLGNRRNLLLVLANVPFGLVGGVAAILVGRELAPSTAGVTLGSLVGFVTLFGVTMRNSIMLVSHFEHLVREEDATWGLETALRGACERVVPIGMTALVTGLGLLPLALGSGAPGREIEGPMAIVILGGLFTSTSLNLLVLPTLALRYGRFEGGTARPA
jgi:CzcA family heavy metal efflux pump